MKTRQDNPPNRLNTKIVSAAFPHYALYALLLGLTPLVQIDPDALKLAVTQVIKEQ